MNLPPYSLEGLQPKIKVSAGLVLSWGSQKEDLFHDSLLASGEGWQSPCSYVTPISASTVMCLSSSMCLCLFESFLNQASSHTGLRVHPILGWPHLSQLQLQWPFQIRSHSEDREVREFWGDITQPSKTAKSALILVQPLNLSQESEKHSSLPPPSNFLYHLSSLIIFSL